MEPAAPGHQGEDGEHDDLDQTPSSIVGTRCDPHVLEPAEDAQGGMVSSLLAREVRDRRQPVGAEDRERKHEQGGAGEQEAGEPERPTLPYALDRPEREEQNADST